MGAAPQAGGPRLDHIDQLLLRDPEAFPGHFRGGLGEDPGLGREIMCLEHLPREAPWGASLTDEPHPLTPF